MTSDSIHSPGDRSTPARARLLSAAAKLFYAEGIRAVGVDRVIDEAHVTRATFYRHFPSKEDLICSYLQTEDERIRGLYAAGVRESKSPAEAMLKLIDGISEQICSPGFRGCPFINAAAEYADRKNPVHQTVIRHRKWFRDTIANSLRMAEVPDADYLADVLVALRDGAMVAGYLEDHTAATVSFQKSARRLFGI
ncbi:TetR family transcriptional regulator [Streptomyces sp. WAC 01325]|uniref:TetR/AcrR family transcriptional regulator n=1 Tax=Streptomyces sp. WAC 01325 TaxID=2203202 RepID=UPI000F885C0B|nr:TetR/AcrR family transcriptional regulator [Streptomyces sp. WAC 01325]RSN01269.1 TetR family transcriptional regulator [Streptomyces sp. WAC 01325]